MSFGEGNLHERVEELEAELESLRWESLSWPTMSQYTKLEDANGQLCAEVNKLTAERANLAADLADAIRAMNEAAGKWARADAEIRELREKLSRALGNAQDTLALGDLEVR